MIRSEITLVMLLLALAALAVFAVGGVELHRLVAELSSALDGVAGSFAG